MSELRVNATATAGGTDAYRYVDTVYFTSNGTFAKADYPWLRGVRVRVQGAGGGAGGCPASGSGESASAAPGGGGGYAESFISDIAGLSSSEAVTVGAGGAGGVGANAGSDGGSASFGTAVVATGGEGGFAGFSNSSARSFNAAASGGIGTSGDLLVPGGAGVPAFTMGAGLSRGMSGGHGGNSYFGAGAASGNPPLSGAAINGINGRSYGGGGSSPFSINSGPAGNGGDGADGIVIVELYA